jgi:hypothetical protein
MEATSILNKREINFDNNIRTSIIGNNPSSESSSSNSTIDNLITEGGENFFNYVNWHGLANDPNLLVLSLRNHFYYDKNELKSITTLINLKKLNLIKNLDSFLHSVYHVLSPKTDFIGCFSDWKTQKGNGLTSRMYKGFLNFLDSKVDLEMDKKDARRLLETHGFKVIDMTEINGLTYFRAQNLRRSVE